MPKVKFRITGPVHTIVRDAIKYALMSTGEYKNFRCDDGNTVDCEAMDGTKIRVRYSMYELEDDYASQ